MFWDIPQPVLERMSYLEGIDAGDRQDGTPTAKRVDSVGVPIGKGNFIMSQGMSGRATGVIIGLYMVQPGNIISL